DDPDTLTEITTYHKRHGELPFRYDGDNWPYDTVCERQKRRGVVNCQYLTPDATAAEMASLARQYADGWGHVLDACCGTGQITKELLKRGFEVSAFDIDWLVRSLIPGGRAVLLLPKGYVDKERPKALACNLSRLKILHRSAVTEKFVHTKGVFEIVVMEKISTNQ
ncbi:MAG: hypothetical protein LBV18_06955, partial [Alistipes sp.]|nr:hypothetical protein [Alistipes sp.]